MGIRLRLRREDDAELAELRSLSRHDQLLGFEDLPADDLSIGPPEASWSAALALPDEVFEALDLSLLTSEQRHRLLNRVLTGIVAS